jgi:L-erythro-3,5-diaminohexanoate dehydrogenase
VLGAGGKSGLLCASEARRRVGATGRVIGLEALPRFADDLRALGVCDQVAVVDARNPVAVRDAVLPHTGGEGAHLTLSCVNVPGVELSAIVATRDRGKVYYFAMSTSFTAAALGAEGIGRDVDLYIGNGYARGHAEHTLALVRSDKSLAALLSSRYG